EGDVGLRRRRSAAGEDVRVRLRQFQGERPALSRCDLADLAAVGLRYERIGCPVDDDDRKIGFVAAGAPRHEDYQEEGRGYRATESVWHVRNRREILSGHQPNAI